MGLVAEVEQASRGLQAAVGALDAHSLRGPDAARLVKAFAEAERVAAAGKALAMRRVAATEAWRADGERNAAAWLAHVTGESVGAAAGIIATADRLVDLPVVEDAFRSGRLSSAAAKEIAQAASVAPASQNELLGAANGDLEGLQKACRKVIAESQDGVAAHERLRLKRFHKRWTDADGMCRGAYGLPPEMAARLNAALASFEAEAFEVARTESRRESFAAYDADALVAMAEAAATGGRRPRGGGIRTQVNVLIDHTALVRGRTDNGEVCEIAGVGPVPVAVVEEMMNDAFLAAVVTDGKDVQTVAHLGRKPTAHQRTALLVRDRVTCVIDNCHEKRLLEIDHVEEWARTKHTKLDELALLCRFHHWLKSVKGYRLRRRADGGWDWIAPERPPP